MWYTVSNARQTGDMWMYQIDDVEIAEVKEVKSIRFALRDVLLYGQVRYFVLTMAGIYLIFQHGWLYSLVISI